MANKSLDLLVVSAAPARNAFSEYCEEQTPVERRGKGQDKDKTAHHFFAARWPDLPGF